MLSTELRGVFGGFGIYWGQAVLLHAIDQGATADVEVAGGLGLVSIELFQGSTDEFALDGLQADAVFGQVWPQNGGAGRDGH
jgi:hypothetical protein